MNIPFLNLLPPDRRRQFNDLLFFHALRNALLVILAVFVVLCGLVLAGKIVIQRELDREREATRVAQDRLAAQQVSSLDEEIRDFNALLTEIHGVQEGYREWSPLLHDLFAAIPAGIQLVKLELNGAMKLVTIEGRAATRDDLLALQEALLASTRVTNPTAPISNLLERENIQFQLNFTLTQ